MKCLFFILIVYLPYSAIAQTEACGAKAFFGNNQGCLASNMGNKCVQLDVSHSLDKQGKAFVYSWNFGDGTVKEGLLTEYCYTDYGSYFITLDLVDAKTKMVIRNELSTTVTLWAPLKYQTDTIEQDVANFEYDKNEFPNISPRSIFWKIENEFYCGETARHQFTSKGFHLIQIGLIGSSVLKQNQTGCSLMGVYIKPTP